MLKHVFISVAEDSADIHAAALLRAAARRLPACRFYGLAGPRMRAAGAEAIADLTAHAGMLAGTLSVVGRAMEAVAAVERSWNESRPDLVVLLDSPELHLRLAARAKRRGYSVLYYIAPQTWASRAGRNAQIARDVDRLACILPFEENYFRSRGVNAEFVGHPLFETLLRETSSPAGSGNHVGPVDHVGPGSYVGPAFSRSSQPASSGPTSIRPSEPLIALLPGSRRHVVDEVLPLQLDVLARMRRAGARVRAAISCTSAERAAQIRGILQRSGTEAQLVIRDNPSLLSAADLVFVASGTATLDVAFHRKPMIVLYHASRWLTALYPRFGHLVIKTPHLSLVNILGGRRIVPEFMPCVRDPGAVARTATRLLQDQTWRQLMVAQMDAVIRPLESGNASDRVCDLMAELLERPAGTI